eukprot:TRINITY_DN36226_c0_g1_i2.p1 TRINITY_DN36226_c0_g1~~TRINITY_DN36226_c0_g1_i2.p1  ORF type:complete len:273 (+),score=37.54 TRINITY_DN36226_c0_g1_i2:267-1085(+)
MTTAVMSTRGCGSVSPQSLASSPVWDLASVIENPVWAEVYAACCCDTGESLSIEAARSFRDAIAAQNPASNPDRLVLRCLRIGATAVSCLALQMKDRTITHADLSDNQLGDHSVLSVRSLIRSLPHLQWLGLSGNLIGPEGARELAEELEANKSLESLVLGVSELGPQGRGFRPNSIGAEGLRAMLEALQRNTSPTLTSLSLCNTSLGPEVQAEQIDSEFERQKVEHPQTVHRVKEGIKSAIAERKRCQETAAEMRERLRQLQERSLIDFRP